MDDEYLNLEGSTIICLLCAILFFVPTVVLSLVNFYKNELFTGALSITTAVFLHICAVFFSIGIFYGVRFVYNYGRNQVDTEPTPASQPPTPTDPELEPDLLPSPVTRAAENPTAPNRTSVVYDPNSNLEHHI